jgi:hypothetical protein
MLQIYCDEPYRLTRREEQPPFSAIADRFVSPDPRSRVLFFLCTQKIIMIWSGRQTYVIFSRRGTVDRLPLPITATDNPSRNQPSLNL